MACEELRARTFLRTLADLYALSSRVRILGNYVLIKANFTHEIAFFEIALLIANLFPDSSTDLAEPPHCRLSAREPSVPHH